MRSCAFEDLAESLLAAVRGDGDGQFSTIRHLLRDGEGSLSSAQQEHGTCGSGVPSCIFDYSQLIVGSN